MKTHPPQNSSLPARTVCARIISEWLTTCDFPERMLPEHSSERALIQEMVYGICRHKRALEAILSRLANREPDPQTKAYLLTGLYQIFRMDHIPPHAAANETVEAAKQDLDRPRINFVNGVLRSSLRRKEELRQWLAQQPVAVQTSHPDLLFSRWKDEYGEQSAIELCQWNNTRPHVTLRANRMRTSVDEYRRLLQDAGIEAAQHPADPQRFLILPSGISVRSLPGYNEGLFAVQDPATLLAVDMLQLDRSGLKLLDACAAPGGKTFAAAEQMGDKGTVIAVDRHEDRLAQLRQNARRLNFSSIKIRQADATRKATMEAVEKLGPFDRILLDVPCSNTGVLRRRPDARWRFSEKRLRRLVGIQARMLNACSRLLAPGGQLVYSTCSLEPEENEQQIERWISLNSGFRIDAQKCCIPPESGMDGAFVTRLIKTATK